MIIIFALTNSCVEPFTPETVTFESALVVEATITDELAQQEIFLSRTFEFEDEGPELERNAVVQVSDDVGNTVDFLESAPGTYRSAIAFRAIPGRKYTLNVQTRDGRTYSSQTAEIPAAAPLSRVYVERTFNSLGDEGVGIFVDSFDPSGNSRNYRYLYEETYQIIAPFWNDTAMLSTGIECGVDLIPREAEERVCYNTELSTDLIITDTNGFAEDRVEGFLVRFINRNNFIITHGYSVLVKQLIQSDAAYTFFETLKEFSGSQSLFSETQVGFLNGNVSSDIDSNEKVLGYFDIASVSEMRIFFDYEDLFPNEPPPPFVSTCIESSPPLVSEGGARCVLAPQVETNIVRYVRPNDDPIVGEGPYIVVPRVCGDCTALGQTEIPEFWTED